MFFVPKELKHASSIHHLLITVISGLVVEIREQKMVWRTPAAKLFTFYSG